MSRETRTRHSTARRSFLVAALTLLHASVAFAQPSWNDTFDMDGVVAHLPMVGMGAVIVGAGEATEAKAAVEALTAVLVVSRRMRFVLKDTAPTEALGLSDAALIARAQALPVDAIIVVRTLAAEPEGASALVVFYSKKGVALNAFTARRGEPVGRSALPVAEAPDSEAARFKKFEAARANVSEVQEYKRTFIGYQKTYTRFNGVIFADDPEFFQGLQQKQLSDAEFYDLTGKPQFAEFNRSRKRIKVALIVPGVAMAAAGFLLSLAGLLEPVATDHRVPTNYSYLGPGLAMFIVGVPMFSVGASLKTKKTSPLEDIDAAEEYNRNLKRRLGLPPEAK